MSLGTERTDGIDKRQYLNETARKVVVRVQASGRMRSGAARTARTQRLTNAERGTNAEICARALYRIYTLLRRARLLFNF